MIQDKMYNELLKTNKEIIKEEIFSNINEIIGRSKIIIKLLNRYFSDKSTRTTSRSILEYDNYWEKFWEKRDIFRTDLGMINNGKPIKMTPFEFKKQVIIKILSNKIESNKIDTVLEVGSGAGLNLLFLAPKYPDIKFVGLEPTQSGCRLLKKFIQNPPNEFIDPKNKLPISNIKIIHGSILDPKCIKELKKYRFDLVFSCAVLEQLNNYRTMAFNNIFSLSFDYFLFYEEWLEANYPISKYTTLVNSDYFRTSWEFLNQYPTEIFECMIPPIQPNWLNYATVFGKKTKNT